MGQLSEAIKSKRNITEIAIPGSHDCGTCNLDKKSPVGHDVAEILQTLGNNPCLGPLTKKIMYGWSRTQHTIIQDQLMLGIRYFDIRLSKLDKRFRFLHCLYGDDVFESLEVIRLFLEQHQGEIVILDFQSIRDCSDKDQAVIIEKIHTTFGDMLMEKPSVFPTIGEMQKLDKRVIVIYDTVISQDYGYLWPRSECENPWANTMDMTYLFQFLIDETSKRTKGKLFVTQAIMTPQTSTIVLKPWSSLFSDTRRLRETLPTWIQNELAKLDPNIVMTDFVSETINPSIIVSLNQ